LPFLVLLLIPSLDWICRRRTTLAAFLFLVSWSVFVQVLGAFAYNLSGWNAKIVGFKLAVPGQHAPIVVRERAEANMLMKTKGARLLKEVTNNVDLVENHLRLWSVTDSQIVYYLTNFAESRRERHRMVKSWLENPAS